MTNSCWKCKFFRREIESWEMPWLYWYVCDSRPGMDNLMSFPFKNTKCKDFKPAPHAYVKSLEELIDEHRA